MTDLVKVLTKDNSLIDNTSPTGQKYKITNVPETTLFQIVQEGGAGGRLPFDLAGQFTSAVKAQTTLTKFLLKFWAQSDAKVKKSA